MSGKKQESADKRTVSTDALETLGTIIGEDEKRDAIHLAVLPVVAAHKLKPGDHVGLVNGHFAHREAPTLIGIVDPFLDDDVKKGQRFWLVVYPRKINSLRHVWTHPDVDDALGAPGGERVLAAKEIARQAIQELADQAGLSFQRLLDEAREYQLTGEYLIGGSELEGVYVHDEFWEHWETYTGEKPRRTGNFFGCSC